MDQQIVRDCDKAERLERGLAAYHSRRDSGLQCPDPLSPNERVRFNNSLDQRRRCALDFVLAHARH